MLQNGMVVGSADQWESISNDTRASEQQALLAVEMLGALNDAAKLQAALDEADATDGQGAQALTAVLFAPTDAARWEALLALASRITTHAGVIAVASSAKAYSEIGLTDVGSVLTRAELTTAANTLASKFGLCAGLSRAN